MRTSGRTVAIVGVALGLVVGPASLRAEGLSGLEEQPPPATAVDFNLGIGSAVGFVGVTLVRACGDHAQIELGTGIGRSGVQLSFMPKLVLGSRYDHFVTGAGLSVSLQTNPAESTGTLLWLNVDAVGFEHLTKNGIAFLVAVGITKGLGGGRACGDFLPCEDPLQLKDVGKILDPQFRLGVGYSF